MVISGREGCSNLLVLFRGQKKDDYFHPLLILEPAGNPLQFLLIRYFQYCFKLLALYIVKDTLSKNQRSCLQKEKWRTEFYKSILCWSGKAQIGLWLLVSAQFIYLKSQIVSPLFSKIWTKSVHKNFETFE